MESVNSLVTDTSVGTTGTAIDDHHEEEHFIEKNLIVVTKPNINEQLSARFWPTFAFVTFRERSPALLWDMITFLREKESEIIKECGKYAHFDLKRTIWSLGLLREEIMKNKTLLPIRVKSPDTDDWNKFIATLTTERSSWFSVVWLHGECYMYRRIWAIFQRSESMKDYDYFGSQKKNAAISTAPLMSIILTATKRWKRSQQHFHSLLKLCLWGNRCDLSMTKKNPDAKMFQNLDEYNDDLLVDQSLEIWNDLIEAYEPCYVDFVLDNSGFELFTDLLLGDYLIKVGLAHRVRFHVKAIPWFISDVTARDFHWMLNFLSSNKESPQLKAFGRRLKGYLAKRSFILCDTSYFWTSAYDFGQMKKVQPCLYVYMSQASLAIIKGDLNYRKLLGDINYESTAPLSSCLRGFLPCSVAALRVIKSDIYCGLPVCTVEWLTEDNPQWMTTGKKAVIQAAIKPRLCGDKIVRM
ncbi:hypothetical protein KR018_009129 [Drosophila ironensis]|nr:hypothetical protein KR018_009129 [Drosophila ironensis]